MEWFMRALDDFRSAIVTADAPHQIEIRFASIFCDKDVTGSPEIARCFPQRASGKQEFISERRLSIDEHHVQPMFEMQILKPVIKQQRIHLPFINREAAAFYAVFVHQHDHVLQVVREHVRLVASAKPAQPVSLARYALITAAQDGNAPSACLQRTGELLNNRRLTRATHGKITNADNETAERAFAENPLPIEIKPHLHQPVVNERKRIKNPAQHRRANTVTALENHVDPKLL